jgi:hypothetical protein
MTLIFLGVVEEVMMKNGQLSSKAIFLTASTPSPRTIPQQGPFE